METHTLTSAASGGPHPQDDEDGMEADENGVDDSVGRCKSEKTSSTLAPKTKAMPGKKLVENSESADDPPQNKRLRGDQWSVKSHDPPRRISTSRYSLG